MEELKKAFEMVPGQWVPGGTSLVANWWMNGMLSEPNGTLMTQKLTLIDAWVLYYKRFPVRYQWITKAVIGTHEE